NFVLRYNARLALEKQLLEDLEGVGLATFSYFKTDLQRVVATAKDRPEAERRVMHLMRLATFIYPNPERDFHIATHREIGDGYHPLDARDVRRMIQEQFADTHAADIRGLLIDKNRELLRILKKTLPQYHGKISSSLAFRRSLTVTDQTQMEMYRLDPM